MSAIGVGIALSGGILSARKSETLGMKIFMFIIGFLLFGIIGFYIELTLYGVHLLTPNSPVLDEKILDIAGCITISIILIYVLISRKIQFPIFWNEEYTSLVYLIFTLVISIFGWFFGFYSINGKGDYGDDDEILFFSLLAIFLSVFSILISQEEKKMNINHSSFYAWIALFFLLGTSFVNHYENFFSLFSIVALVSSFLISSFLVRKKSYYNKNS